MIKFLTECICYMGIFHTGYMIPLNLLPIETRDYVLASNGSSWNDSGKKIITVEMGEGKKEE